MDNIGTTEENHGNVGVVCRDCMEKNKGIFEIEIGDYSKIRFGDYSKIRFGDSGPGEYMWVKVMHIDGNKIEGILDNDPIIVQNVKYGDKIIFDKGDICDRIRDGDI